MSKFLNELKLKGTNIFVKYWKNPDLIMDFLK